MYHMSRPIQVDVAGVWYLFPQCDISLLVFRAHRFFAQGQDSCSVPRFRLRYVNSPAASSKLKSARKLVARVPENIIKRPTQVQAPFRGEPLLDISHQRDANTASATRILRYSS